MANLKTITGKDGRVLAASKTPEKDTNIDEEAKRLGVNKSRISFLGSKSKDPGKEMKVHNDMAEKRVKNRIDKAKAKKLSKVEARKKLLKTRLKSKSTMYTREQRQQMRWELKRIEDGSWFPPRFEDGKIIACKMPKVKTEYDRIMDLDD
jgi:uncharacterized protein involved in exopolysaccharide biosynthesis